MKFNFKVNKNNLNEQNTDLKFFQLQFYYLKNKSHHSKMVPTIIQIKNNLNFCCC